MVTVGLRGIRCRGFHGVLPEEQLLGADYELDLSVGLADPPGSRDDRLEATVDYSHLHRMCVEEMQTPRKLLEVLAASIAGRIRRRYAGQLTHLDLRIEKLSPPLPGVVAASFVELSERWEAYSDRP